MMVKRLPQVSIPSDVRKDSETVFIIWNVSDCSTSTASVFSERCETSQVNRSWVLSYLKKSIHESKR